jgi:RHS repeat-associated protein
MGGPRLEDLRLPPDLRVSHKPRRGIGLTGQYYSEIDFTSLVMTRIDEQINFTWPAGPGGGSVGSDTFSVRWTGYVLPKYTETYTFFVDADDGADLWINGTTNVPIALTAGVKYAVRLQFWENVDEAHVSLRWQSDTQTNQVVPKSQLFPASVSPTPLPQSGTGLTGEYYDNIDFTALMKVRVDGQLNFDWGTSGPGYGIDNDTFSIRWTGEVVPRFSETTTFYADANDRVRLWVNNQLLVDHWTNGSGEYSGPIALTAGVKIPIKLEFADDTGSAHLYLRWSSASLPKQVIPQGQLVPATLTPTPTSTGTITPTRTQTMTRTPTKTPTATPTAAGTPSLPSGEVWRFYYLIGSQRVAVRVQGDSTPANNGVFYLLGDHLSSTSMVVSSGGQLAGELRYKAFGEARFSSGTVTTDYRYTGQRQEAGIGLYYYNARWYDPALGRFISPDTAVPGAGKALAFNRFAYALDNPVGLVDPSGHRPCEDSDCQINPYRYRLTYEYGFILKGNLSARDLQAYSVAARKIRSYADRVTGGHGRQWMDKYMAGTMITPRGSGNPLIVKALARSRSIALPGSVIGQDTVFMKSGEAIEWFAHELAHIWDSRTGWDMFGFKGGLGDYLNQYIGGDVTLRGECRFCNYNGKPPSTSIPEEYRFGSQVNGGYGNGATADYFAEAFTWAVFDPSNLPREDVKLWIDTMIALEAFALR